MLNFFSQQTRGRLLQLLRDLDAQLDPHSGNRPIIAVLEIVNIFTIPLISFIDIFFICILYMPLMSIFDLFQARNEIKHLEDQAKLLAEYYDTLKTYRDLLLTQREKTFHGIFFNSNFCN